MSCFQYFSSAQLGFVCVCVIFPAVQIGAVDCSGNTERFCVSQGVREFPGVALVIDGKATAFDGNTGERFSFSAFSPFFLNCFRSPFHF